jgi:two-component sensor histidine kinase
VEEEPKKRKAERTVDGMQKGENNCGCGCVLNWRRKKNRICIVIVEDEGHGPQVQEDHR